jgi:hypothetical protein
MDPITTIAAVNAAITLAETLIPRVQELFRKGEITAEQQQEVLRRYNSLKAKADGQFSGPEWQESTAR